MRLSYLMPLLGAALVACGSPDLPSNNKTPDAGTPAGCVPNPETGGVELCNDRDDDCNGLVDDAPSGGPLRQSCQTECGGGSEQCVRGAWQGCTARVPETEVCNGLDDDCNDQIDEVCNCVHGETRPCGSDVGACRAGIEQCVDGDWTGNCIGEVGPVDEICNNGIDDNCDDSIDEGCQCTPMETQSCGTDVGECTAGQIVCGEDARWGETCEGEVRPVTEVCNGLDDDCDGEADWNAGTSFGWRADPLESNETCPQAVLLDTAFDGGAWISVPVSDPTDITTFPTMYPPGDEDWYQFRAEEGSNGACVPFTSQCAFVLVVQLELSDPALRDDYEVCFTTATCTGANPDTLFCSNSGRWQEDSSSYVMAIKWGGVCTQDDSRDVRAVVRSKDPSNRLACGYYQLHARFYYDSEESCPN